MHGRDVATNPDRLGYIPDQLIGHPVHPVSHYSLRKKENQMMILKPLDCLEYENVSYLQGTLYEGNCKIQDRGSMDKSGTPREL